MKVDVFSSLRHFFIHLKHGKRPQKNNYVKCTYFDYLYYNTKYRYILHVRRNENFIWINCKRLVWRAADVGHNFTEICKMTREKRDSRILHAKFLSKSFPKSLKWFRKKKFIIRQARTWFSALKWNVLGKYYI